MPRVRFRPQPWAGAEPWPRALNTDPGERQQLLGRPRTAAQCISKQWRCSSFHRASTAETGTLAIKAGLKTPLKVSFKLAMACVSPFKLTGRNLNIFAELRFLTLAEIKGMDFCRSHTFGLMDTHRNGAEAQKGCAPCLIQPVLRFTLSSWCNVFVHRFG